MSIEKNEKIKNIKLYMEQLIAERKEILRKIKITGIEGYYQDVNRLNEISQTLEELNTAILSLEGPTSSNQEIDLYLNKEESNDEVEYYHITPHDSFEKIGYVRVTLKNFNPKLGNIGYGIEEEYRGNHYALQALELLRKSILNHGLNSVIITTYPNNYASIRTIEQFGGSIVSEANQDCEYNTYEVVLEEKEQYPRR